VTTLRFAVGSIIGPIRVCVASELIIAASAAEMESTVGSGIEILENSCGGGDMPGEWMGIVQAKGSNWE
jgi:hypothetical protein